MIKLSATLVATKRPHCSTEPKRSVEAEQSLNLFVTQTSPHNTRLLRMHQQRHRPPPQRG